MFTLSKMLVSATDMRLSWLLDHFDDNQLGRLNMNYETAALGMTEICHVLYVAAKISLSMVFNSVYYKDSKMGVGHFCTICSSNIC
jgi:hypothetical protein